MRWVKMTNLILLESWLFQFPGTAWNLVSRWNNQSTGCFSTSTWQGTLWICWTGKKLNNLPDQTLFIWSLVSPFSQCLEGVLWIYYKKLINQIYCLINFQILGSLNHDSLWGINIWSLKIGQTPIIKVLVIKIKPFCLWPVDLWAKILSKLTN